MIRLPRWLGSSGHDSPRSAAYAIFGTLVAFKVVTAIFIVFLQPTAQAAAFLVMTSGLWLALIAIPLVIGGIFSFRRVRGRAKRRRLIHQEWNVGGSPSPDHFPSH